jgi:hypothetical protein
MRGPGFLLMRGRGLLVGTMSARHAPSWWSSACSRLVVRLELTHDHECVGDNCPTIRTAGMSVPLLVAVDDDPELLREVERELTNRYVPDYRVCCLGWTDTALATLEELADAGEQARHPRAGRARGGPPCSSCPTGTSSRTPVTRTSRGLGDRGRPGPRPVRPHDRRRRTRRSFRRCPRRLRRTAHPGHRLGRPRRAGHDELLDPQLPRLPWWGQWGELARQAHEQAGSSAPASPSYSGSGPWRGSATASW